MDKDLPMPDNYYIGNDCKNNHGKGGKTVRHLNNDNCIRCAYNGYKRRQTKKYQTDISVNRRKIEVLLEEKELRDSLALI